MSIKVTDDPSRLAMLLAGVDPESVNGFGDGPVVIEDRTGAVAEAIQLETIQRAIGMIRTLEGEGTAMIEQASRWRDQLSLRLVDIVMAELDRSPVGLSSAQVLTFDVLKEITLRDAPAAIVDRGADPRIRLLSTIASTFAPEVARGGHFDFMQTLVYSLNDVLTDANEDPLVRQAAVYSLVGIMTAAICRGFNLDEVNMVTSALDRVIENSGDSMHLKEAGICAAGILCVGWPTHLPACSGIVERIVNVIEDRIAPDEVRQAAVRTFGVMHANLLVNEPQAARVMKPLIHLSHGAGSRLLCSDANILLRMMGRRLSKF